MSKSTFVGFGFGPIQSGLFLYEAFQSGNFSRLVVAEIVPELVEAVRSTGGCVGLNIATADGVERHMITGVEMLNPRDEADRATLVEAIAEANEIATALPSIQFYGSGDPGDPIDVIGRGIRRKREIGGGPAVLYAAENNNHAAEALQGLLGEDAQEHLQCLNTVIGKMSGVLSDSSEMSARGYAPLAEGIQKAFLVETFNRILVSKIRFPGFNRGIAVFEEKDDLLPFEEAKLYGHNATHALLGYLLQERGKTYMAEAADDPDLVAMASQAFHEESGAPLCEKYAGVDELFTQAGYSAYVEDLMVRILNPYLMDEVARITRDPRRKLGWSDRLVGTMRLALSRNVEPARYALGASAALRALQLETNRPADELLREIWHDDSPGDDDMKAVLMRISQTPGNPLSCAAVDG